MEEAIRNCLLDIKQVYGLMDAQAPLQDTISCCKQIVANIKNLDSQAQDVGHQPLVVAVDKFRTHISEMIRASI
jgi:imidazole glycerol phosphate synthase subunit HisF